MGSFGAQSGIVNLTDRGRLFAAPLGLKRAAHELAEGIGYKLSLPPPRHDKLFDFRVLVIDTHPLCPTAASITIGR